MFKKPPIWFRYTHNGAVFYFEVRWSFFVGAAVFAALLWLSR